MLVASKAEDAYTQLEKLGRHALPAIICQMDDRRELAIKSITLQNNYPGATQPSRHYTPQVVVDVLVALLHQAVGNDFGFIQNGASEEERTKTINGWRIFLWYLING